jgi:hypothetical protein
MEIGQSYAAQGGEFSPAELTGSITTYQTELASVL